MPRTTREQDLAWMRDTLTLCRLRLDAVVAEAVPHDLLATGDVEAVHRYIRSLPHQPSAQESLLELLARSPLPEPELHPRAGGAAPWPALSWETSRRWKVVDR